MSVEAYKTIGQEYEQYTINATQVGEVVMSLSKWLKEYRGVCPEDVQMIVNEVYNSLEDVKQFIY